MNDHAPAPLAKHHFWRLDVGRWELTRIPRVNDPGPTSYRPHLAAAPAHRRTLCPHLVCRTFRPHPPSAPSVPAAPSAHRSRASRKHATDHGEEEPRREAAHQDPGERFDASDEPPCVGEHEIAVSGR